MKRIINKAAIGKTKYDSRYVGVLAYHAIQIKEEGVYTGYVIYKNKVVDKIQIKASEKHENMQVNLDFQKFELGRKNEKCDFSNEIKPGGYLILMNSRSDKMYQFKLEKAEEKKGRKFLFNSEKLQKGDLYACTLLRPGTYEVRFNKQKTSEIYVAYPSVKTSKEKLSEAVRIQFNEKGTKDKEIKLLPMQGLVFETSTSCNIQIVLVKEEKFKGLVYDKPKRLKKVKRDGPLKKYKWRNPKYKQTN